MKLSDIMSAADLAIYAEVGLVLFLVAFIGVVIRVLWPGAENNYEKALMIPLSDEPVELRSTAKPTLTQSISSQKGAARR